MKFFSINMGRFLVLVEDFQFQMLMSAARFPWLCWMCPCLQGFTYFACSLWGAEEEGVKVTVLIWTTQGASWSWDGRAEKGSVENLEEHRKTLCYHDSTAYPWSSKGLYIQKAPPKVIQYLHMQQEANVPFPQEVLFPQAAGPCCPCSWHLPHTAITVRPDLHCPARQQCVEGCLFPCQSLHLLLEKMETCTWFTHKAKELEHLCAEELTSLIITVQEILHRKKKFLQFQLYGLIQRSLQLEMGSLWAKNGQTCTADRWSHQIPRS